MENDPKTTRPPLCPCKETCTPIYNGIANDDRLKTGDLNEGYSGDCMGRSIPLEYMVGGNLHRNDMNHCIFTPLKGVIRFQINEGDVESMVHQCKAVLNILHPEWKCEECGVRHFYTHYVISGGRRLCCRCYYGGKGGPPEESEETV